MSVLLNTSAGDIVIDLFVDACPIACENFLKLCAVKYYNGNLIFNVQQNYIMQSGDPTGTGRGGSSIFGLLRGKEMRFFPDEIQPSIKTNKVGYVGMSRIGQTPNTNQSQFFITLRGEDMEHFGKEYTIFGLVAEGFEVLETINNLYCDEDGRPYQDIRILHTYILEDPYPDPKGLQIPPSSPLRERPEEEKVKPRLPFELNGGTDSKDTRTEEEINESIRQKEAKSRAIVLEMVGDLPDADVKPPDEVLFVCKLNPVTRDEDLELIFSRFGPIKSCEIIRDFKTGDSLNYAFIEFETEAACIEAYEKMNNAVIDERRIKVDFSQSVSKLWNRFLLKPRQPSKPKPAGNGDEKELAIYGRGRSVNEGNSSSSEVKRRGDHRDAIVGDKDATGRHDSSRRNGDLQQPKRSTNSRERGDQDRGHRDSRERGHRDRDRNQDRERDHGRDRDRHDRERNRRDSRDRRRSRSRDRRDHDERKRQRRSRS